MALFLIRRLFRMLREEPAKEDDSYLARLPWVIESVTIEKFTIKDGIVSYVLIVKRIDGKPTQEVRRRFSEFADANERMKLKGALEARKEMKLNRKFPFPAKDLNNANMHLMAKSDEELEVRRKDLEGWMNETIGFIAHRKKDEKWANENGLLSATYRMEKYVNMLVTGTDTIPVTDEEDSSEVRESKYAHEDKA